MTSSVNKRPWQELSVEELAEKVATLSDEYEAIKASGLSLDLTRGKPGQKQIELASELDGILAGNYKLADGSDARNYGGIYGIPEARRLGAEILNARLEEVIASGNSSLTLMYQFVEAAYFFGLFENGASWLQEANNQNDKVKFLCPVPGYDRHFTICESLGIDMIPVPMTDQGPDVDFIQTAVEKDPLIKGIWCVPRFSNPGGQNYSDDTVRALAKLPEKAGPNFMILWDNAYSVHDLYDDGPTLVPLLKTATDYGQANHVAMFASTSKVTFAGAGVSWLGASEATIGHFIKRHGTMAIGPDKVNQLRHVHLLPNLGAVKEHMKKHADILRPKFEATQNQLEQDLGGLGIASWAQPRGGYFVSFDCLAGSAKQVVALAAGAGVKLTAAGATWPYGTDPQDSNIRLAPSFPELDEVKRAMVVFTLCVKLASAKTLLEKHSV